MSWKNGTSLLTISACSNFQKQLNLCDYRWQGEVCIPVVFAEYDTNTRTYYCVVCYVYFVHHMTHGGVIK